LQVRSDGAEIAVAMTILPMRDGDGGVSGVACIATPIGRPLRQVASTVPNEADAPRLAMSLNAH
jgi:hypothetical protein